MAKALVQFTVTPGGDGYILAIEDEDGDTTEYSATYEQLDLIMEALDTRLDDDEEDALSAEDEDEP